MASYGAGVHEILQSFAAAVRASRRARRWTQQRLASVVGVSQGHIARLERAQVPDLSFRLALQVLDRLDARMEVRFIGLPASTVALKDRAHARCVAYVARRLGRIGFEVASEVDIGGDRWRGFADILAFHPRERILVVIEVKTEIHDLGDLDRQIGVAERGSWDAARVRGWRPRAMSALLLILATDENDRRLAQNRSYFDEAYRLRSRTLNRWLRDPAIPNTRGARGLAMLDPATRRTDWLRPAWIDGRRSPAPYSNRGAFLVAGAARRRAPHIIGSMSPADDRGDAA